MTRYDDRIPAIPPTSAPTTDPAPARPATARLRPTRSLLALEPRIVFDGAAAAALADPHDAAAGLHKAAAGQPVEAARAPAAAERATAPVAAPTLTPERAPAEQPGAPVTTIVFVDASVANPASLLTGLKPGVEVVMLDKHSDGVQQIANALKGRQGLDSIQIISEGNDGRVSLGSTALTDSNIDNYQAALANWGSALREGGDILLFGCNVANTASGDHLVNRLAALTGADVAASADSTGAAAMGGNWILEKHTGEIEAGIALSDRAMADYAGLLGAFGTTDGVYDFGADPGAITGDFKPIADKLLISKNLQRDGTSLYAEGPLSGGFYGPANMGEAVTVVFKAEGGSIAKNFTFQDFTFSTTVDTNSNGSTARTLDQLKVVLSDASGNVIRTIELAAGTTKQLPYVATKLSTLLNNGVEFNETNVASVAITVSLISGYQTVNGQHLIPGAPSEINFMSIKLANISATSAPVNVAPTFVGTNSPLPAAQNGAAIDIKSLLHVSDTSSGQTLTWSQSGAPSNGTLTLTNPTTATGSTDITPTGTFTYTPNAGFAGTDTFTVQVSDGTSVATRTITVNVAPATPGTPDLAAASDSGVTTDNITNAASLTFSGTSAAGDNSSTVQVFLDANNNGIYDNGEATASATVNNGAWTVTGLSTSGLADRSYTAYSVVTSSTGAIKSAVSSGLTVTLDKTVPGTPTSPIAISAASDSGSSNADGRTNVTNPQVRITLAGTSAVAGDTVELLLGGNSFGTPMVATLNALNISNGYVDMTIASGSLGADGAKVLTSRVTDVAGNVGTAGGSFTIRLDTTAPAAPTNAIIIAPFSDSGSSNSDGITKITSPLTRVSLTGTNALEGDQVELLVNGASFGTPLTTTLTATNISNGYVDLQITTGSLGADGVKILTARVTDIAGNVGTDGGAFTLTLDTTATAPSAPVLATASDSGS